MVSSTRTAVISSKCFPPSPFPSSNMKSSSSSSPCSLSQHVRTMPSRKFKNHHSLRIFESSAEQQFSSPSSNLKASASLGRFSGAVHGSNSRKSLRHKRPDRPRLEHDNKESDSLQSKELTDEPSLEDSDGHTIYDDAPSSNECNSSLYDDTPYEDEASSKQSLAFPTTCLYDSIHGDFWLNDPYYQEFEALDMELARQRHLLGKSSRESGKRMLNNEIGLWIGETPFKCPKSSEHNVEGDDKHGKRAAVANKTVKMPDNKFTSKHDSGVLPLCRETDESSQELSSTFHDDSMIVLERGLLSSLDGKSHSVQKGKKEKDVGREASDAESPLSRLGSLQNVENSVLQSRQGSVNEASDGMNLECRSVTEIHAAESDDTPNLASLDTRGPTEASDASLAFTSNSGESGNQLLTAMVDQVGQVVEQVAELLPDSIKEQVVSMVDQVEKLPTQISQVGHAVEHIAELISDPIKEQVVTVVDRVEKFPQVAEQVILKVVDQIAEALPDPMVDQVGQVAEQVSQTAEQIVEQVASQVVEPISTTASQLVSFLSTDEDDNESDDEFEAYRSKDIPEFKGRQGLDNFTVLHEEQGLLSIVYDFYIFMLKRSLFDFILGMFAAPILLSVIFTIFYLPEFNGLLALDENVRRHFLDSDADVKGGLPGLQISWQTIFQVFMFSVSLSTGLQPELAPLSPYTLVVANLNALVAQLIFVFLSGAVFARLSQPSQPIKCSKVAIICPPPSNRRLRKEVSNKALLARYVLVGPQPCELVDVKLDLTYHYNTLTRWGTYFRTSQSLKLVRPEIAFLNHGMLVRHIIDDTSPLYQCTQGMMEKEDAVFSLSVVGLERSSMQSIFHVQHYCVYDKDIVWDAEFVDMILINKKNKRVVDHSLLSTWRPVVPKYGN